MSLAGAIRAGLAYVELTLNDKQLTSGLKAVTSSLKSWGKGVGAIGAATTAAGLAIEGGLAAAVHSFVDTGDQLEKMSIRTGMSVEQLSLLSYAAGQSDASIEDVGTAAKHMAKFMLEAHAGSKEATDALDALGLKFDDLRKLHPDELFQRFGKAIAGLPLNTLERNGIALRIYGRDGLKLLPMLKELDALLAEGTRMGMVVSAEDAHQAVELGDAWDRIVKTFKAGMFAVGAALGPELRGALDAIQGIATGTLRWVQQNRDLAKTVAVVAAGLVLVGGVLTAIGLTATGIGFAWTGLASVAALILSPWTLLAVAVGIVAYKTGLLESVTKGLKGGFAGLIADIAPAWEAAINAVKHGELEMAFEIVTTKIKLIWAEGVSGILGDWIAFIKAFRLNFMNGIAVLQIKWLEFQNLLLKGTLLLEHGEARKQWQDQIQANEKEIEDIKSGRRAAIGEFGEEERRRKAKAEGRELSSDAQPPFPTVMSQEQWDKAWAEYQAGKTKLRPLMPDKPLPREADLKEVRERERQAQLERDRADEEAGGSIAIEALRRRLERLQEEANALPPLPDRIKEAAGEIPDFTDKAKLGALGTFSGQTAQSMFGGDLAERTARATERSADYLARIAAAADGGGLTFS